MKHYILFTPNTGPEEVVVYHETELAVAFSEAERQQLATGFCHREDGRYADMRRAVDLVDEAKDSGLDEGYLDELDAVRRRLWESGAQPEACAGLANALAELTRIRGVLGQVKVVAADPLAPGEVAHVLGNALVTLEGVFLLACLSRELHQRAEAALKELGDLKRAAHRRADAAVRR